MGYIYSAGLDKYLTLYTNGEHILLRTINQNQIGRTMYLANNYHSELSSVIFNQSLYYSYLSTSGEILVKSLKGPTPLFAFTPNESTTIASPVLISFSQNLYLIYIYNNLSQACYFIKCTCPLLNLPGFNLDLSFENMPEFKILMCNNTLILHIFNEKKSFIFEINKDLTITELISKAQTDSLIENIKVQYNELMDTATAYKNELINLHKKIYPY